MMKKILLLLFFAAPLSMIANNFSCFDYQSVVQALPAYMTAMDELQKIAANYEKDFAHMQREYQNKVEKYKNEVNENTPENIRSRRQQEIIDMENRLQQAYDDNNKALQAEQQKRMQPVILRVQEAVTAVAKEGNYVYIVDKTAAQSSGLFLNDALNEDVTPTIKKKLGITAADEAKAQQRQREAEAAQK